LQIIYEINRRFIEFARTKLGNQPEKLAKVSIVSGDGDNQIIRMANLSIVGSYMVNGVAKLHSELIKTNLVPEFYELYPEKFTNVTNGIAHRRWLCYSNPSLAALLDETIGDGYRTKPCELRKFEKFADDKNVLDRLAQIKRSNKVAFSDLVFKKTGVKINPDSVFDVQAKRLHEYKRQLLNAMRIVDRYLALKENPDLDIVPQTFIFGAKAAPGYDMAKQIIKLICSISEDINKNPKIAEKLQVVFLENYCVSLAESLMPAADISEQISLAGKEASGTGNMKFMINGALTVGTLDGANVEMLEEVGKDNIYIFGLTTPEVDDLWLKGYNASSYYHHNARLKKVVDAFNNGFNGESFANIYDYLLVGRGGISDPYMCLADFDSYMLCKDGVMRDYLEKDKWQRMSLMNIAGAGKFASDRSIEDYAKNIWHLSKITSENKKK
ncbi:MAG: glycogen/starch/alpha-glucan family phosphorylase, partial [Clostridia bacterium]|nr:glycogen/starch/alpha-glucan family phosphorylase [Clostridia bacterium]